MQDVIDFKFYTILSSNQHHHLLRFLLIKQTSISKLDIILSTKVQDSRKPSTARPYQTQRQSYFPNACRNITI